jgi:hypothetical protein
MAAALPGAVRVAGCQAARRRETLITRISGNDTMNASKAPGQAVTGTGPCALTVSSRTEPDTARPPATGTLTPDDANPPLRAHKESRRTSGIRRDQHQGPRAHVVRKACPHRELRARIGQRTHRVMSIT